ncbi:MAG: hypothetical protein ACE5GA_01360 [Candidatus Zixiibacteriota bacterium]
MNKKLRQIRVIAPAVLCVFATTGSCSKQADRPATTATLQPASELEPAQISAPEDWQRGSAAGANWRIPSSWEIAPPAPMRAGTYLAAASEGDSEGAECRVNFFGAGQGGSVEGNINRWRGQMEVSGQQGATPEPLVSEVAVNGLKVSVIELTGTYLHKARPMARQFTRKPGFKMFAAIVMAPEGVLFFKMTGPEKTMEGEREAFRQMLGSLSV